MLYTIAAGAKIDTGKVERFRAQLDDIYANPFKKTKQPQTAAEVKEHLIQRIDQLIDDIGEEKIEWT